MENLTYDLQTYRGKLYQMWLECGGGRPNCFYFKLTGVSQFGTGELMIGVAIVQTLM